MGDALIDVTGIGNAIVDVLAKATDESLTKLGAGSAASAKTESFASPTHKT